MKLVRIKNFVVMILLLCMIFGIWGYIANYVSKKMNNVESEKIKGNMLLIQAACKIKKSRSIVDKNEDYLIGKKLSEDMENNIIKNFLDKKIISEEEYEKYYIFSNEDLQKLELEVVNGKNSFYLVNYDNLEIINTEGLNGKYKLSEME